MEQLEKDRQAEALYNVLVNPADKRLHVYDLQNLVNYYPQSSLLYLLVARSASQDFIKSGAVYYNSKSLFRLVNDPENRPEVTPAQVIDIDHFQFNDPPPIDPLIAQNYEPTIDDLAMAEINKRKFGTETEWTSYDPDDAEQESIPEKHEPMYVASLPGTPQPQPVVEQPEAQPEEPVAETTQANATAAPAEEGPSDEVVRMREERRRFFQSFNASHDEDADHLIDPFHLAATPVPPPVTPAAFEPVVNEAASWNTLNFDDADPKVEFDIPGETPAPETPVGQSSTEEITQQEEPQPSAEEVEQSGEEQPRLETHTEEPVAIEVPTVASSETEGEAYEEIAEIPEAEAEQQETQPVAADYQSTETWHNWDEVFEEIDEIPDPFAPVYQEKAHTPVEFKEETSQQEPVATQHDEPVFEEITDTPRVEHEATVDELAAANDEAAYEEIADIPQPEPIAEEQAVEEAMAVVHDEPVYDEIAEAPKHEPLTEGYTAQQQEIESAPEQINPGEPEMREMYSEIDEPVYDEIEEAPRHEPVVENRPVEQEAEAAHEIAEPIAEDEPEPRQMYSEIDDPVYDEIAESPLFETPVKSEPMSEETTPVTAHQEPEVQEYQPEAAAAETIQHQPGYQQAEAQPEKQKEIQHEEEIYDEIEGEDIFFIPPSPHGFVPPVITSVPDMPSFKVESKSEPVAAEPVQAQPYSEDVSERVQQAAQSVPVAEEVPVPEEAEAEDQRYTPYTEAEIIEETPSAAEHNPVNKEPVAEFDGLIAENIVTADYFSFDRSRIKEPVEQEPGAAYTDYPDEGQQVAKYHDENMPYTFLWWLDKTRREHAGTYQPYSQPEPMTENPGFQQEQTGQPQPEPNGTPRRKEEEIIERFIKEEPQIKPPSSDKLDNENKARYSADDSDELVTETLARIYTEQMLYHKAIATYKKLILRFPEKSRYFAGQIELLENKIK